MENDLAAIVSRTELDASKPRYRAEDLIYEAWEARGRRRVELAREALVLWPDCVDAYVLLAQAAASLEEARELLEEGVAAGERALGRRVFAEDAGDFWLIFETRPYMGRREVSFGKPGLGAGANVMSRRSEYPGGTKRSQRPAVQRSALTLQVGALQSGLRPGRRRTRR